MPSSSDSPDIRREAGFGRCRGANNADDSQAAGCRHGQRGRRGPRMFDAGMLRYVVLNHIAARPRHGYDIIKLLQEQSGGMYTPSPGMIYPMLSILEDMGHVSAVADGNKKLYAITAQGQVFLQQNQTLVAAIEERIAALGSAGAGLLRLRLQALRDAVCARTRGQDFSPEQLRKIEAVLDRALTEIQSL